jgi:hypothetical protein
MVVDVHERLHTEPLVPTRRSGLDIVAFDEGGPPPALAHQAVNYTALVAQTSPA